MSVSLVKEFTKAVRAPRALWVPFPFGRPFGAPEASELQRRVMLDALDLLRRPAGPVLEDFQLRAEETSLDAKYQTLGRSCGPRGCSLEDATATQTDAADADEATTPYDGSLREVLSEIRRLAPLHQRYRQTRHGRTQVGLSGITPERIAHAAEVVHRFAIGDQVELPASGTYSSPRLFVRHSIDDLKAFYMESHIEEAPEDVSANVASANDWLWSATWVGRLIIAARDRLIETTDTREDPNWVLARGIVPRGYGRAGYTLGHVVET